MLELRRLGIANDHNCFRIHLVREQVTKISEHDVLIGCADRRAEQAGRPVGLLRAH